MPGRTTWQVRASAFRGEYGVGFQEASLVELAVRCMTWGVAAAGLLPLPAAAQQTEWEKLPRMQLERQFAGPLQDTIIQRWRDPADGTICYIYLPISAQHSPPTQAGFVQYGANTIGSISCVAAGARPASATPSQSRGGAHAPAQAPAPK
jgi:hypothetical protein